MVSIFNISSSLSICTPSLTLITKKKFGPPPLTTYHSQHTAFSCSTSATLDSTMNSYSVGYTSSHSLKSHLTQQVLLSHLHEPTFCASPFRPSTIYLILDPRIGLLATNKSISSASTAFCFYAWKLKHGQDLPVSLPITITHYYTLVLGLVLIPHHGLATPRLITLTKLVSRVQFTIATLAKRLFPLSFSCPTINALLRYMYMSRQSSGSDSSPW